MAEPYSWRVDIYLDDNYTGGTTRHYYQSGLKVNSSSSYSVAVVISYADPTRTGYNFLGYTKNQDGTGTVIHKGDTVTVSFNGSQTKSLNLYAKWQKKTYTVSYDANSGSGAPSAQTKTYGVSLTLSNTTPTRTGYTFSGWNTAANGSGTSYSAGGSYTANAAATLYAQWTILTYTISYNKGSNGTGTNTTATKTYNVALTLKGAIFTRTGYEQTGWAKTDGGAKAYNLSASYTTNAAQTLYPVWTATVSTVSTTNGTLGTVQTITITRHNNSFTHDLTYQYGSLTGTIATGVGTSHDWTPAKSLAAAFPSAKSGVCTITCTTKNGGTTIGTSTTTCTLTIPSSVKCTVASVAVAETVAGLNAKFGAFIQGKSKVSLTGTINSGSGSPAYGATVTAYSITTNSQTLTSNGATTGLLKTSGSNSYSFKITDTRGYTHTKTGTYNVLAYSAPSVSATAQRNDSDDTKIDISYSYTISACGNNNDKALKIKYKKSGGSYTTVNVTISQYSDTGTYSLTGLDSNGLYEVNVIATDYFGSAQITQNVAPVGNRVFDISATDKTIARHMSNPSDGWDHQANNEQFHGIIDVVPRRCSASLPSAGWYRVLNYGSTSATNVIGGVAFCIDMTLFEQAREMHKITLNGVYHSFGFGNEYSVSNVLYITKVRYTYGTDNVGHVDIYYAGGTTRTVGCYFDVKCRNAAYSSLFASVTPTPVASAPDGETVLSEYTFSANGSVINNGKIHADSLSVGTYTSFSEVSITAGSNEDVSFANGQKGIIVLSGAGSAKEIIIVNATSYGAISYVTITSNTNFTYTATTNNLNIANGASTAARGLIIYF